MKKLMMSAAAFAMALGVAAASAAAEAKTKACWVYVGSIGDFGWTYEHNQGRLAVEKELGDKVETAYVENVPKPTPSAPSSAWPATAATSSSRRPSASWSRR